MSRRWLGCAVCVALVLAACNRATSRRESTPSVRESRLETTTTLPAYVSLVAEAVVPSLHVFDAATARVPVRVLESPWTVDPAVPETKVPQVFLVQSKTADGWVKILLPIRPNGSSGWVRTTDVSISEVTYRVRVQLTAHQITVFDRGEQRYQGPVAVGAPATPTPPGSYYIRALIKASDPHTVYGPFAYGLSSHSESLTSFAGGDAEIGLHGNDDPSALGHDVTHGCVRMDNDAIARFAALLPLGTPVDIVE